MNVSTFAKRSILGLVGAAAITASIASPAFASNDVTQVIVAQGTFTASIASASMNTITYSNTAITTGGTMTMSVIDGRGNSAGWNVTIAASDFDYVGASSIGIDIPNDNFSITATDNPGYVTGQPIQVTGPVAVSSGAGSLASARETIEAAPGTGSGQYTQSLPISLLVPAFSQVGTYTSTLTVMITSGP